jgi:hypothetical protein
LYDKALWKADSASFQIKEIVCFLINIVSSYREKGKFTYNPLYKIWVLYFGSLKVTILSSFPYYNKILRASYFIWKRNLSWLTALVLGLGATFNDGFPAGRVSQWYSKLHGKNVLCMSLLHSTSCYKAIDIQLWSSTQMTVSNNNDLPKHTHLNIIVRLLPPS